MSLYLASRNLANKMQISSVMSRSVILRMGGECCEFLELTEDDTKFRIQLVRPSEVPKLKPVQVYITEPPLAVPRVIRLLAGQNRGIYTERWTLRHQQDTANGQLLIWGIDKDSAAAIKAADNRLFFGLGRVTFKVSRDTDQSGVDT